MRTARKFFALLMSVIITISCFSFAGATDNTPSNKSAFEQLCDDIYSNYEDYIIYNKEGTDISASFYEATIKWYNNKDISALLAYCIANIGQLAKYETMVRGSYQTVTTSQIFYDVVRPTISNDYEIVCILTGRYTYNFNTGKISSARSTFALDHVGISGYVNGEIDTISTTATISADEYSVLFRCQFTMKTTVSIPVIGDITMGFREEVTGPYIHSFRASGG